MNYNKILKILFSHMKFEPLSVFFLTLIIIFCIVPKVNGEIIFEDVTNLAGIEHDGWTYGSFWGDFNGDGWADLWQGNHGSFGNGSKLFENNKNGTFFEVGKKLGLEKIFTNDLQDNHGGSWSDFDNDGDQDIIILVGAQRGLGNGSNIFLVFEKDSVVDLSVDYGLDYPLGQGRMPLWFDWNQDGLLDLLMSNNQRPDKKAPTILFSQTIQGFIPVKTFEELDTVPSVQYSDISGDGKMDIIFSQW